MSLYGYEIITGTNQASPSGSSVSVIGAQGAGKVIRVVKIILSVKIAGTGGNNAVALTAGFFLSIIDADTVGVYNFDFGPIGYPLNTNTALTLVVSGGATLATARATAIGYVT